MKERKGQETRAIARDVRAFVARDGRASEKIVV